MATNLFAEFEEVELAAGAREIVYGVNVLQEQARVATVETTGTVGELVAMYREQLGLPTEVTVFVDGIKLSNYDTVPAEARRIEIVKPAGQKGSVDISLEAADAVRIIIAYEDTSEFIHWFIDGTISEKLVPFVQLSQGRKILRTEAGEAYIGHPEVGAVRMSLRPLSDMRRRVQGGVAETSFLTVNAVTAGLRYTRLMLNGEPYEGCRELKAGEILLIVLPGQTSQADFDAWAADQRQNADGAVWSAQIERDEAMAARATELAEMNWARLRIEAAKPKYREAGVKLAGPGRNGEAIAADILAVDFPEIDEEAVYNAYLAEYAPELLEGKEPFKWFPNLPADQQPADLTSTEEDEEDG